MTRDVLERMVWKPDRVLLDDLVFRLQTFGPNSWELGDECFVLFKVKPLVDQYAKFLAARPDLRPQRVLELGIWKGGSTAFWFEVFRPRKHVAVDRAVRVTSDYFRRYVERNGLQDRIAMHWGIDQADRGRLKEIARTEFDGPLDLVIDDCSHLYRPTRASFEALFPLLRPGGLYIIEDWAWWHWKEFQSPTAHFAGEIPPTKLVFELIEATGSSKTFISSVTVFEGFTVVERGTDEIADATNFDLDDHIVRRPAHRGARLRRVARKLRRRVRQAFRR